MNLKNVKLGYKKIITFLLQFVAMAFIFVVLTDRQAIFIIKDFLYSLQLGTDVYTFLARIYIGFKMMIDIPSAFALFVVVIQLLFATITLKAILFNNCPKKVLIENDKLETHHDTVESVLFSKHFAYLENLRLLN